MSYLRYLCLFVHSDVQHIVSCFGFFFLCLLCPRLPVSLDCPFFIASSVFYNFIHQMSKAKQGDGWLY